MSRVVSLGKIIEDDGSEWAKVSHLMESCIDNGATWASIPVLVRFIQNELKLPKIEIRLTSGEFLGKVNSDILNDYAFHRTKISYYLAMQTLNRMTEKASTNNVPSYAYI